MSDRTYDANTNLDNHFGYRVIDGHKVKIPEYTMVASEGKKSRRLDPSIGYRKVIDGESYTVHVVRGFNGIERYAQVQKPPSDTLVSHRCVRLSD